MYQIEKDDILSRRLINGYPRFLERYLVDLREAGYQSGTVKSHLSQLVGFLDRIRDTEQFDWTEPNNYIELNQETINNYLLTQDDSTYNKCLGILRKFFYWMVSAGYIPSNPVKGIKNKNIIETREFTKKDIDRVLFNIEHPVGVEEKLENRLLFKEQNRAILLLLITTNLTQKELTELNYEDIESGMIHIIVQKGGQALNIPLCSLTRDAIQNWLQRRNEICWKHGNNFHSLFLNPEKMNRITEMDIELLLDWSTIGISKTTIPHNLRMEIADNNIEITDELVLKPGIE